MLRSARGIEPAGAGDAGWQDAVLEMRELLLDAAGSSVSLPRAAALTYVQLRDRLLKDGDRHLPGFLRQCLTIDRFRDFIFLYHHDAGARTAFITDAFGVKGRVFGMPRDVFSDLDF